MFELIKIFGFFAYPSNSIGVLCILGLLFWLFRLRRTGIACLAAGVTLLAVFGFSPIGNVLMLALSERFPAWTDDGRAPDGIIVLGGAIDSEISEARNSIELDASAERALTMLQLAKRFPQARIVFSGGSGNLFGASVAEAPIAGRLLEEFGTDPARIILESTSRTTAENADDTRKLVEPKPGERWLLVTSAFHMPRSVGLFRKAGFDVEAYPVDWRTRGWEDALSPMDKLSKGLARSDAAMHEWAGLVAYWLAGKTSALLPGPR